MLAEIERNRYVTSDGHFNPWGVKPKISRFNVRHCSEPLHVPLQPTPVARI